MKTILLIRHGKTYYNENNILCGALDAPLSENGLKELQGLKEQGIYPKTEAAHYYTSSLRRAQETLKALFGDVDFTAIAGFSECDFGPWEGREYDTYKDDPHFKNWLSDRDYRECGAESMNDFNRRVVEATDAFVKELETTRHAVLVSHGGAIVSIMNHLFPHEDKGFNEWQPSNGHGYLITFGEQQNTYITF